MAVANADLYRRLDETTSVLREQIAQRERVEVELPIAQRLDAVGQLAVGVAHEIDTPLQYVGDRLFLLGETTRDRLALLAAHEQVLGEVARPCWPGRGSVGALA